MPVWLPAELLIWLQVKEEAVEVFGAQEGQASRAALEGMTYTVAALKVRSWAGGGMTGHMQALEGMTCTVAALKVRSWAGGGMTGPTCRRWRA